MMVKLGDICTFEKGITGIQKSNPGKYPLVVTSQERKTSDSYQFDCEAVCIPLVSSTGHGHKSLNYIHYQSGKFALGTILVALIPKDSNTLNMKFLREYLFNFKDELLVSLMKGGANVTLAVKSIQEIKLDLPSIEKQKQIVENINTVYKHTNNILNKLESNNLQIKELKESLLNFAIMGNLVSHDTDIESAKRLLDKIKIEREKLIKDGLLKKDKPLQPIDLSELSYKLPEAWEAQRLGNLCRFIDYRGKTPEKVKSGIRLITAKNVKFGYLSLEPEEFMRSEDYKKWMTRGFPSNKDILFTTEAPLGNLCLYEFNNEKIALAQRIITLHPFSGINSKYLMYCLMSNVIRKQIIDRQTGITAKGVKSSKLKEVVIPVPSTAEQERIVEKIELLLAMIEKQKNNVFQEKYHINDLIQSVFLKRMKFN